MATVIKAGNVASGAQVTSDSTGILQFNTGSGAGTTAMTIGTDQSVTFAGAVSSSGNQTVTGNLTVDGNTTLGNANTDTILMTAAPSIGGAGLGMGFGFRNRIINGAMVIDQRNAGAAITPSSAAYTTDRWRSDFSQASKMTFQQSSTAPAGFTNSLQVTVASAVSPGSGDAFGFFQRIEGFNTADFAWGSASATAVTLSFWVRSSVTGTYSVALVNSAGNRSYPATYTISSANTFEYKTITIPGDTSGTWLTNNGIGITLEFCLGAGSTFLGTAGSWQAANLVGATGQVSWIANAGATFYITGVQLEKGSTATSFDYRPYGTELALCQRYFEKSFPQDIAPATNTQPTTSHLVTVGTVSGSEFSSNIVFAVPKRASPTMTQFNPNAASNTGRVYGSAGSAGDFTLTFTRTHDSSFALSVGRTGDTLFELHWTASAEL